MNSLIADSWQQMSNAANCTVIENCRLERAFVDFGFRSRLLMLAVRPDEVLTAENFSPMKDLINDVVAPFSMLIFIEYIFVRAVFGYWPHIAEYLPNIYSGALLQTFRFAFHVTEFYFYDWVYHKWHWSYADSVDWTSWTAWLTVVVLLDLCYYGFHRCGHEMAIFWTMHQVHHSSEYFNYSVAFRIPHLHDFVHSGAFQVPLALLGVPVEVTFVHKTLNLLFQFWTHSDIIPKLPRPIEYLFNTPSHHRVHHARQPKYLDKNYGSVFIIWDRMFGTFYDEDENDQPIYGLTTPQRSLNVFYYQYVGWIELYEKVKSMNGWKNKLQALIKGPGWEPGSPWTGFVEKLPVADRHDKPELVEMTWFWQTFLIVDLLMIFLPFVVVLTRYDQIAHSVFYTLIVVLYVHAYCAAKVMEGHTLAAPLQTVKLGAMSFLIEPIRLMFENVSPAERLLLTVSEAMLFSLFISASIYVVVKFNNSKQEKLSLKYH